MFSIATKNFLAGASESVDLAKFETHRYALATINTPPSPFSIGGSIGAADCFFIDDDTLGGFTTFSEVISYQWQSLTCSFKINLTTGLVQAKNAKHPPYNTGGRDEVPIPTGVSQIEHISSSHVWYRSGSSLMRCAISGRPEQLGWPLDVGNNTATIGLETLNNSAGGTNSVAFNSDGTRVYVQGNTNTIKRYNQDGNLTGQAYASGQFSGDQGPRSMVRVGNLLFVGTWRYYNPGGGESNPFFDVYDLSAWSDSTYWFSPLSDFEQAPGPYQGIGAVTPDGKYLVFVNGPWGYHNFVPVDADWSQSSYSGTLPWGQTRTSFYGLPLAYTNTLFSLGQQVMGNNVKATIAFNNDAKRIYFSNNGLRSLKLTGSNNLPLPSARADVGFLPAASSGYLPIQKVVVSPNSKRLAVLTSRNIHILSAQQEATTDPHAANVNCRLTFNQPISLVDGTVSGYQTLTDVAHPVIDSSPLAQNWSMIGRSTTAWPGQYPRIMNKTLDGGQPDLFLPGSTHYLGLIGDGAYISRPTNSNTKFTDGDFTLECWLFRANANYSQGMIFSDRTTGSPYSGIAFYWRSGGALAIEVPNSAGNNYAMPWPGYFTGNQILPLARWCHVALTRSGSQWRLHVNGYMAGETTYSTSSVPQGNVQRIGWDESIPYAQSFIANFRITKGVARYGTATFVPPVTI